MNSIFEKSLYIVLTIMIVSCATAAPMLPSAEQMEWTTYHHDRMGVVLSLPSKFLVQEYEGDLFFSYLGKTALRVTLSTPEKARERGLWPISPPIGDVTVAGRSARQYVYDHHDGPIYDHFVAFVFEHRGESLALAFHTEQNELNSTQKRILESLVLR